MKKTAMMKASGHGYIETTYEMIEAFEAVLPQALLEKLRYFWFSFAVSDRNDKLGIIIECQIGIPDEVDYCPLTKYLNKDIWPGFSSSAVASPEYQARIKELRVPAAIPPAEDYLEYYEQWNEYNEYVEYDCFRYNAKYYIPLEDVSIPSIIKAAKIFAGYGD